MTGRQSKQQMFFTLRSGEPDPYRLLRRHLYSLILAGIGCCLFPVVMLFVDKTGAVLAKVVASPGVNDPFRLTGGVVIGISIHLLQVIRRVNRKSLEPSDEALAKGPPTLHEVDPLNPYAS